MSQLGAVVPLESPSAASRSRRSRLALWVYVGLLAWAPFPLGGNREWSSSLAFLIVASCWILLGVANWEHSDRNWEPLRRHGVALGLAGCTILWAFIQVIPAVPLSWAHPAWGMASFALRQPLSGTISLNPW